MKYKSSTLTNGLVWSWVAQRVKASHIRRSFTAMPLSLCWSVSAMVHSWSAELQWLLDIERNLSKQILDWGLHNWVEPNTAWSFSPELAGRDWRDWRALWLEKWNIEGKKLKPPLFNFPPAQLDFTLYASVTSSRILCIIIRTQPCISDIHSAAVYQSFAWRVGGGGEGGEWEGEITSIPILTTGKSKGQIVPWWSLIIKSFMTSSLKRFSSSPSTL